MSARPEPSAPSCSRARAARVRRHKIAGAAALCGVLVASAVAWAYWSATAGSDSLGGAVAAAVTQGATPTAAAQAGRNVDVSWGASTLSNGHAVDGYLVKRYDAVTAVLQTTVSGCAGTVAATSCLESGVPSGSWKYTVTPVLAANWRGAEGLKSGIATVATATLSLDTTLFGAPLPRATTGSLAGFAANEGVGYRLDASTALTGSPSSVGAAGTATISSLAIPSTSDGAHTVYALGDASPTPSVASTGIVVDTTAPSATAEVTPTPNAAGWNATSPVQVALDANDGSGSGIDRIRYTTDGTDPATSATALDYASPLSLTSNTTVRYRASDVAGNASAVQTQLVKIDLTTPVNALSLSSVSGGAYLTGATVYYRGADAGSFTLTNALTDAGGSGVASSATAALTGTSTGWSHSPSVVALPSGGPYVSSSFSWSAGAASAPAERITGSDVAGITVSSDLTFTPDSAVPAGGALTVNGAAATGGGSVSGSVSGSFSIARTDYADGGSGLLSSVLTLESATLSSAGGIVVGTCGTYGSSSVITGNPAQTVSPPGCYRYTLTGVDRLGNTVAVSTVVKADSSAPSAPALTLSGPTGANTYVSGATVFINPQAGNSGSFQVAATSSDLDSGIQKVNFPALTGFASGSGDDSSSPFATTYSWSGAVGASGAQTVMATNGATGTTPNTFTVTPDTAGPAGGILTVNDAMATGGGSVSGNVSGAFLIARTDYADGGSGSGLASSVLTLESATLSSLGGIVVGTCGTFGSSSVITGNPAQTKTGPSCYRYTLTGTDRVGNIATISTIVVVDSTPPSTPGLTLSAPSGSTYISGNTVYINAQAGKSGGFQIAATTTDADTGIQKVTFPAVTGFSSGAGDDVLSPFATTYAWSGSGPAGDAGSKTVTATNTATGIAQSTFSIASDTTAPAAGVLTVNGSATSSFSTTGSFSIARTDYTDGGSGLVSSVLTREAAPLISADGVDSGTCGTYGTTIVLTGMPAQSVTGPACYRYTLTGTDQVGNVSSTSALVKVDTTAPSAPGLTLSSPTGNTYVTGSTVLISPKAGHSGSFQVAATTADSDSGIQKVNFPAPLGFGSGAGDDSSSPFGTTYSWSGAVGATGSQTVTSTNNAGATATSSFTVSPDIVSPTITAIASKQSNGGIGNGALEIGDQLILTFSEELLAANVPSMFTATETRASSGLLQTVPHVFLSIPSFTNGAVDTGDASYLSSGLLCILGVCSAGNATFGGTAAMSAGNTVVTLTVTSLSGTTTDSGQGTLVFQPGAAFEDRVGNAATASFSTASSFKLF
jgi:hypothetical protein